MQVSFDARARDVPSNNPAAEAKFDCPRGRPGARFEAHKDPGAILFFQRRAIFLKGATGNHGDRGALAAREGGAFVIAVSPHHPHF